MPRYVTGFSTGDRFVKIVLSGGRQEEFHIGDEWPLGDTDEFLPGFKELDGTSITIFRKKVGIKTPNASGICAEHVTHFDVMAHLNEKHHHLIRPCRIEFGNLTISGPVLGEVWKFGVWDAKIDCGHKRYATVKVHVVENKGTQSNPKRSEILDNIDRAVQALRKEV
ncbi:hypothetical protein LCGC14_2203900 [marine sediment metagenome]|uniref:Uncharacterized protein n=1 Tax=marine sediment metagenome TaxID=412755 RepID=A0A0F9FT92_9ZZZZ